LDAPKTEIRGTSRISQPLWYLRSLRMVSREFRMEELALKISSRNDTWAVGRYPCMFRRKMSSWREDKDRGPNISSGVVNRVSR